MNASRNSPSKYVLAKLDSSDAHALACALQKDCLAHRAECREDKLDAQEAVCKLAARVLRSVFRAALRGSARDAHAAAALLVAARTALGSRGTASYIRLCSHGVLVKLKSPVWEMLAISVPFGR